MIVGAGCVGHRWARSRGTLVGLRHGAPGLGQSIYHLSVGAVSRCGQQAWSRSACPSSVSGKMATCSNLARTDAARASFKKSSKWWRDLQQREREVLRSEQARRRGVNWRLAWPTSSGIPLTSIKLLVQTNRRGRRSCGGTPAEDLVGEFEKRDPPHGNGVLAETSSISPGRPKARPPAHGTLRR